MQIEDIFEIERQGEKELFNDVGNKMLLWYKIFKKYIHQLIIFVFDIGMVLV